MIRQDGESGAIDAEGGHTEDGPALAGLTAGELEGLFADWGEPRYRAAQVFRAIHKQGVFDPASMTTLPQALRRRLAAESRPSVTRLLEAQRSSDGTTKLLLGLSDERRIETVIIPEDGRRTVCVSTQVGCPIGCVFCASGVGGLTRNLHTAEIVEQPIHALRELEDRPTHVVVMGMGEPLLNLGPLAEAIRLWTNPEGWGISPRRITVSTASRAALIDALLATGLRVNLALSLHAPDDVTRQSLVPTSRLGRVEELIDAATRYARDTGRDATVEYVLVAGQNDHRAHAETLGRLVRGRHLHVNLIPLNPVSHRPDLAAPTPAAALAFADTLEDAGASVTLRTRRGEDIDAACGQLALDRTRAEAAPDGTSGDGSSPQDTSGGGAPGPAAR